MFLSDPQGKHLPHGLRDGGACVEQTLDEPCPRPDDQLVADCHALMCQFSTLLSDIDQAADVKTDDHARRQASLCEANDQVLELIGRIMVTPASTECGLQAKSAAAHLLLVADRHDDPSPFRDRLVLSFVRDAARLSYPGASDDDGSGVDEQGATATIIVHANACLAAIRELAVTFARKDQIASSSDPEQNGLDATILALAEQEKVAIETLISLRAFSAGAINAKRIVLRRMLEAGMSSCDAHPLCTDLARSYFDDLNTFLHAGPQEHEPTPAYHAIWNSLSSSFRWLTSTVQLR